MKSAFICLTIAWAMGMGLFLMCDLRHLVIGGITWTLYCCLQGKISYDAHKEPSKPKLEPLKVVLASSVPSENIFATRQYALGNGRGPYAVVDSDLCVYVLGSFEECQDYCHSVNV